MQKIDEFFKNKFYIEISIVSILFTIALFTGLLVEFIIYLLYFIIFLEIIRAVMSFVREQRVKIRILVDAFIILVLRELIVNVVKINKENINSVDSLLSSSTNFNIFIFSGVILFLFFVRYLAIITSPDKSTE